MVKSAKNYQTLSIELDTVLSALQSPDVTIDEAVELYEKGQKVLMELEAYLKSAENKISKLNRVDID
jgi:exodeoxyribonuclease VII small subunit